MAGNIVEQDKKALKFLLRFDSSRGEDSTGLAVVHDRDNKIEVFKRVGVPDMLFAENDAFDAKHVYKGPLGKVFIGHNRAATRGKISDENAHPFHHNGIVGAHNGTLVSASTLPKGNSFDVDSEAIFYNLAQDTPEIVIPKIWGAYALTWYDDVNDSVYIIRNKDRPLYWCRRKDQDVFYWASESWMLYAALARASISHSDPVLFEEDKLFSIDVTDTSALGFRKVELVEEGEIKGYVPPPQPKKQHHNNNTSNIFKGNYKSNVLPFHQGHGTSSSSYQGSYRTKDEIQHMKMLVDSNIIFRIGEVKTGVISGAEFISAYPDSPMHDYDIRIYADNKSERWKYWLSKKHRTTFVGRVKKVVENRSNGKQEVYFLIDLRSIVERDTDEVKNTPVRDVVDTSSKESVSDPKEMSLFESMMGEPVEERFYEGFNNTYLTHHEWKLATKQGCASCSGEASEHDCDLVMIGHDDFLCGKCVDIYPEMVKHVQSLKN